MLEEATLWDFIEPATQDTPVPVRPEENATDLLSTIPVESALPAFGGGGQGT